MIRRLHALYNRTEKVKIWFSSRFTHLGKLFLLVALISFFFGLNTQRTMIYQIFAVSSASLLFSFLVTLRFTPIVKITRFLPETCVAGKKLRYRIIIENQSSKKVRGILYQENAPLHLPDLKEFASTREDGEEKRNIFDRKMGYYRWLWLIRNRARLHCSTHQLPEIRPGQSKEWEVSLEPVKRGSVSLQGYTLVRVDPLGLCKKEVQGGDVEKVLVLPQLYGAPQFQFQGSRKYHQGGITLARELGDSTEFLSLREYVAGDPVKHIDWKASARSGKTNIKQYRDEYFSRFGLVLDSFTRRRYCDIFEEAVSVAASIMMTQDSVNNVLDLLFVGNECLTCTLGSGLASQQRMLEALASVETCRDRSFQEMAALVRSHAPLLSGIILVLIDLDEERKSIIRYLTAHKIPTRVIVLTGSAEQYSEAQLKGVSAPMHLIDYTQTEQQIQMI